MRKAIDLRGRARREVGGMPEASEKVKRMIYATPRAINRM